MASNNYKLKNIVMLITKLKNQYKLEIMESAKEFPRTAEHLMQILSEEAYVTNLRYGTIMDLQLMAKGSLEPFSYFNLDFDY